MDLFTLVARLSLDASDYEKGINSAKTSSVSAAQAVEKVAESAQKVEQAMQVATDAIISTSESTEKVKDTIQAVGDATEQAVEITKKSYRELQSDAMTLARQWEKAGMSASEARKKAHADLAATGEYETKAGKRIAKANEEIAESNEEVAKSNEEVEKSNEEVAKSYENVGDSAKKTGDQCVKAAEKQKNPWKSFRERIDKTGDSFEKITAKAIAFGTLAAHAIERAVGILIDFGKNAIQSSADIEAEISLYQQVFGELESVATGALESISKDTNILATRLRGIGTSAFMQFKGAGVDAGNAISMMDKYTRLAADAAAAYNISIEEADQKLRSFIRGNTEAGDSIGLFTSEAQRNERAMSTYRKKWTDLTEAQKQMLMLNVVDEIYTQQEVIGQAAREGHEWENVIGNLNTAFSNLSATVGSPFREALIPVIEKMTGFFSDDTVVMRIGMLASSVGGLADKAFDGAINLLDALLKWSNGEEPGEGFQIIEDIFSAVGNVATAAYDGAKGVVDTLINFGGSSTDALSQAGEFFGDIKTLTESEGFKTIVSVLGGALAIILALNNPLVLVGGAIAAIATNWESVKDWAEKAWTAFQNFVNPIEVNLDAPTWEEVKAPLKEKIDAIIEGIKGIANWTLGAFGLPDVDTIVKQVTDWWTGEGSNTYERIKSVLSWAFGEWIAPNAESLTKSVSDWWEQTGKNSVQGVLDWTIGELYMPLWEDLVYGIRDWWVYDIEPNIKALAEWNIGEVNFPSWEDISTKASTWWNTIKDAISDIFTISVRMHIGDTSYTPRGFLGTQEDFIDAVSGGTMKPKKKEPGKAVGIDYVPYNDYRARLHEGEAVLTKAEASDWRRGGSMQSIDYNALGSVVGSAVREALVGIGLYTDDGTRIADLTTRRVSRNIANDARYRRYQPV